MFQRELRDLAHVPRWQIARKLRTQSVAEHCYYTALYANQLQQLCQWHVQDRVLNHYIVMRALWHDVEECFTGDIPGPVKRAIRDEDKFENYVNEGMDERFNSGNFGPKGRKGQDGPLLPAYLSILRVEGDYMKEVELFVKAASLLDEVMYLAGEIQMGNKAVRHLFDCSGARLREAVYRLPVGTIPDSKPPVQVSHDEIWKQLQDAITFELRSTSKLPA